jgi:hypothetical protein
MVSSILLYRFLSVATGTAGAENLRCSSTSTVGYSRMSDWRSFEINRFAVLSHRNAVSAKMTIGRMVSSIFLDPFARRAAFTLRCC